MKARYWSLVVLGVMTVVPAGLVRGQEGPPPATEGRDGGGGGDRRPPRHGPPDDRRPMDDDRGPRDGMREDGPPPRRDGAGPRPSVPVGEAASGPVRAMMGYLQLVQQYKEMTQDPTAAGVAAVVTAGDVLRKQGPEAAAAYFEKVLPQVTNPSIRNAIHLQLADFYRVSGKADKALEHLTALMTQSAAGVPAATGPKAEK